MTEDEYMKEMQDFYESRYAIFESYGKRIDGVMNYDDFDIERVFNENERCVFVIFDIVGITLMNGIYSWLIAHNHHKNWARNVMDSFSEIGHPKGAKCVASAQTLFSEDPGGRKLEEEWDKVDSYLFDYSYEIYLDLYEFYKEHIKKPKK